MADRSDFVSRLQEFLVSRGFEYPIYAFTGRSGPIHDSEFTCCATARYVNHINQQPSQISFEEVGHTKKLAKKTAARKLLEYLLDHFETPCVSNVQVVPPLDRSTETTPT